MLNSPQIPAKHPPSRALGLGLALLLLSGCGNREASHTPPLIVWPFEALRSAFSNSRYDAKRNKLVRYLNKHLPAFEAELASKPGPVFQRALELALVPPKLSAEVFARAVEDQQMHHKEAPEQRLEIYTTTLMVHGQH